MRVCVKPFLCYPVSQPATPMSSSLRQRLKRSRRQFVSPLLSSRPAKKPKLAAADRPCSPPVAAKLDFTGCSVEPERREEGEREEGGREAVAGSRTGNGSTQPGSPKNGSGADHVLALSREREVLRRELGDKEERLRKLKMVKMYRSKVSL